MFFDGVERISYLQDVYLVIAMGQVSSSSDYQGLWDSSVDISDVYSQEFSKLGIRAQSPYVLMKKKERTDFLAVQKDMLARLMVAKKDQDFSSALDPGLRKWLMAKGYDNLIWVTWSGYLLYIRTLGLSPYESFVMSYWVHDLRNNKVVWTNGIVFRENVDLGERSGKEYLEKDSLSGFKKEVEMMVRERFKVRTGRGAFNWSVGQAMGFE